MTFSMAQATLRAFVVTEPQEGHAVVIFSRHAVVARREGANDLDTEFQCVECRRAPALDEYAPGPVSPLVLLDHGWWFECVGCNVRITADLEDEDADGNPIGFDPVDAGSGSLYCSPTCEADDLAERAETKRRQISAIAQLTEEACRRWRGILIEGRPHAYVIRRSDRDYVWWSQPQVSITFSFPGSRHGLSQYRLEPNGTAGLLVPLGDMEAWHAWRLSAEVARG